MSRKIIGRQFATNGNPCIIGFFKGDFVGAQVAYRSDGMINSGHFPIFFWMHDGPRVFVMSPMNKIYVLFFAAMMFEF